MEGNVEEKRKIFQDLIDEHSKTGDIKKSVSASTPSTKRQRPPELSKQKHDVLPKITDEPSKAKSIESPPKDTNSSKPTSQSVQTSSTQGTVDSDNLLKSLDAVIENKSIGASELESLKEFSENTISRTGSNTTDSNDVDLDDLLNELSTGRQPIEKSKDKESKAKDEEPKAEEPKAEKLEEKALEIKEPSGDEVVPPPASTSDDASKGSSTESETISLKSDEFHNKYITPLTEECRLIIEIKNKFAKLKDVDSGVIDRMGTHISTMKKDIATYTRIYDACRGKLSSEKIDELKEKIDKIEKIEKISDKEFLIKVKKRESAYLIPFIDLELECKGRIGGLESGFETFGPPRDGFDYGKEIQELYDKTVNVKAANQKSAEESPKSNEEAEEQGGKVSQTLEVDKDLKEKIDALTEKYNNAAEKFYMKELPKEALENKVTGVYEFVSKFQTLKESIYGELDEKIPEKLNEFSKKISSKGGEKEEEYQSRVGEYINKNKEEVIGYLEDLDKKLNEMTSVPIKKLKDEKKILKGINEDLYKTIKSYNKLAEEHKKFENINLDGANVKECYEILIKDSGQDSSKNDLLQKTQVEAFAKAKMEAISYNKVEDLGMLVACLRECKEAICNLIKPFNKDYASSVNRLMEIRIAELARSYRSGDEKGDLSARFSTALSSINYNVKKLHEAQTVLCEEKDISELKKKFTKLNDKYLEFTKNCTGFSTGEKYSGYREAANKSYMGIPVAGEEEFLSKAQSYIFNVVAPLGSETRDKFNGKCGSIQNDFLYNSEDGKNECLIRMYELAVRAVLHLKNKIVQKELAQKEAEKGLLGKGKRLFSSKKKSKDEITKKVNETSINAQKIEKCFEKVGAYFVKSEKFTRKDLKSKLKDVKKICGEWYKNLEDYLSDSKMKNMMRSFDLEGNKKFSEEDKRKVSIGILLASLYELGNNEYIIGACDGLKKGGLRGESFSGRDYFKNAVTIRKGIKNAAVFGGSDLSRVKNYINSSICAKELEGWTNLNGMKQCIKVLKNSSNKETNPPN